MYVRQVLPKGLIGSCTGSPVQAVCHRSGTVVLGSALRQCGQLASWIPVLMSCWGGAALGNAAAAVPEEVMLDRELTRTGSTLYSKQSSRSSALSSKFSTRSSGAPRYGAWYHIALCAAYDTP